MRKLIEEGDIDVLRTLVKEVAEQQGQAMVDMVNAQYGTEWTAIELNELGRRALLVEREFNKAAGFTAAADRLPEFLREEPLPPHDAVFDVSDRDLDAVYGVWEGLND